VPEAVAAAVRVREALAQAGARLAAAGCDSPRLDAELLLAAALGVDRSRLVVDLSASVDCVVLERFEALVRRRVAREPVAYILGHKEFRRLSISVDRRVLIPRPETELLVDVGLSLEPGAVVADVGTGSGAVALALKDERPDLVVVGTDVSQDALAVARCNAERLGLDLRFVCADLLEGVDGPFDAVLANLPYVAEDAGDALPAEIRLYEPPAALFAGSDGLDVVRRLVATVDRIPFVALEVGSDQAPAVGRLLDGAGFGLVRVLPDLAGHERVVVGRRSRGRSSPSRPA
jgi:release factor glutamine methyltransferase